MPSRPPAPDPRQAEATSLAEACKQGDLPRAHALLAAHPDVLHTPDYDTRFTYTASQLWSPLGIAATHGHEELVRHILSLGANPVPYEVSSQYHHLTYHNWLDELRERGHLGLIRALEDAIQKHYAPFFADPAFRPAVVANDLEQVRALLAAQPDLVRQNDPVANTALHLAAANRQVDMVRLLLEHGAPVNARNGDGRTPALVSLIGLRRWGRDDGPREIFDLLLRHGAEWTPLTAALLGDEHRLRELLAADPALANAPDACFRRPLSGAVANGHTEIVRLLLEHGAHPNAKEPCAQGGLSLRDATGKGHVEIVRLLLEYGANPRHWVDSAGDSLYAAFSNGDQQNVQMLYARGATMELSIYAAAHRIDVIAEVLDLAPERANEVMPHGWDARGNEDLALDIMRLAIHHGARFEQTGGWNLRWTALQYPRVFQLLQAHGANPDLPLLGLCGDMRRRYDSPAQQLGVIKFLVEQCGANLNASEDDGITPLGQAARAGHQDIVEYLLSRGANPNPDGPAWTKPIALAEHRGFAEIVEILKRNGAATAGRPRYGDLQ